MKRVILLSGALGVISAAAAQSKAPNVVLILADDMRGSAMGFLGEDAVLTPNLDQFSADATTFTQAHIMGGTSGAISMPSRAMLMSGKYLHTLKNNGGTIPNEHATLGETLQKGGYTAFHTGKWHNGGTAYNRSFNEGTAIYFGGMADHWNVPLHDRKESAKYTAHRPVIESPMTGNIVKYEKGDYAYSGKHSVEIFTDTAIDYLDKQKDSDKPFFLSVSFMLPHDPRSTYKKYLDLYDVDKIQVPDSFVGEHPFDNGELRIRDEKLLPFPRTEEGVRTQIRDYYACVSHMDHGFGRLIEKLKEMGVYDNTIIVFAADNGLAVGQHGLLGKQNMYEHSVRVPLMIKGTNEISIPKNEKRDELCLLIDIFPTLCDLLDIEKPATVDGQSLRPIIEKDKPTREYLYYGYVAKQRAVSDGEWKLIEYFVKGVHTTQLFNLKDDPKEMNDLSKEKKYAKKVAQLRKQMKIEAQRTNDPAEWVMEL